jgi:hypothetical protein
VIDVATVSRWRTLTTCDINDLSRTPTGGNDNGAPGETKHGHVSDDGAGDAVSRSSRRATEEAPHASAGLIHLVEAAEHARDHRPRTSSAVNVLINPRLLHVVHVEHDLTYRVGEPVSEPVPSRDSRAQRDLT